MTIQSGSIIEQSGFIGGFASGANIVNIRDCTVEENVKIGWSKDNNAPAGNGNIGSVGGLFNGTIINCSSAADVYGINFVGGMVGQKGQSMGPYDIINCSFTGTVTSSGKYAGGIAGGGYNASSAPNTPGATIQNCYVSGTITGETCVGGIFGGEPSQIQAWDLSYIQDNCFYGTVSATGEDAHYGAIIGRMRSLNNLNIIENNYFVEGCGTEQGIGTILYLDTSADVTAADGCTVFDSSVELPDIRGIVLRNRNRTDDPLGKDADNLAAMKSEEEFKDGTVVELLNNSDSSLKNWIKGTNGPVHSRTPVWSKLAISGSYRTEYTLGDELDLTGAIFTATRSDGLTKQVSQEDIQIVGFDSTTLGNQTVTAKYGIASCSFVVTVLKPAGEDITVSFTLLGDYVHEVDETEVHTLTDDNLETWMEEKSYTVSNNATVLDVIETAFDAFNEYWEDIVYSFENPSGNYITSITYDGTTLAEFTHGGNSGWMYTLNGVYSKWGVSEQYLEDGDVIVFHYTDDYTKEAWDDNPNFGPAKKVMALIDAIGEVTLESRDAIEAAENAYNELTPEQQKLVSNYQTLLDARAAYDKLVEEAEKPTDPVTPVDPVIPSEPTKPTTPTEPETPIAGMNFSDVSTGDWFYEDVAYVYSAGLMNGMGNGKFAPDVTTTRGMIVTILYRLEGEPSVSGSCPFGDVNSGSYYEKAIAWAAANDIVNGYGNSRFGPNDPITREQMAVILCRYAQYKKLDVSVGEDTNILSFHDVSDISEYAFSAMQWACGDGIMQGDNGNLMPRGNATRAQIAALLHRFCEEILK